MELNVKMYPDKVCRACLNESSEMTALSAKIEGENRTLFEMLSFVTNINIIPRNGLPRQVCSECESILYKADAFKRRCLKSEAILSHQYNFSIEGHFNLQLSGQTLVKDENAIELDQSDLLRPSQSSVSLVKPLHSNLDAIFDTIPEKDEKGKIFGEISCTNLDKHFCDETKHIIPKESITQSVKEEDSSDFDSQNDMLFDFEETNAFETLPIEHDQKTSKTKDSKPLTCVCGTVFNNKDKYKTHLKTKKCKENKKSSKIKLENKNSKNSQERIKKTIKCPECNIEFATVKACKIHQRKHRETDDTGNFECSMCMRKFCRKSSYTNHMKQHDLKSSVKYTCETCKRDFQHKAHLDNHILALHSRDKGFLCEVCMTYFATQESLDIHKESHKIEKKHQCHICKKGFYMLSTLNDHLRVHTGEKPFLCSICGRGFSQKTNLAQHMRRHQGLKPFKCEDCNKRFVSKGELVAHNRKHSGAHPFVCDDCGSGFTTSSSLVKHRRVHTGERPYACDLCPMRFAASGTLKNHRRTHTGEKPFQCSYCEKAFVQRHDLIAHIRGHTGERPYTCGCGQAFRKASALKAHVRLHGKEPQRELTLLQHSSVMLHGEANIISEHTPTV